MELIGHRGASDHAPENTKESMMRAYEAGAVGAECDVHLTKDKKIVLLHDQNLKRTTGLDEIVQNLTYDEIKNLDAGSFKEDWKGKGVRVPLLQDVLDIIPSDSFIVVELKEGNDELPVLLANLVKESLAKSEGRLTSKNIIFISFDLNYIDQIKKLLPDHDAYYITCYLDEQNQVQNKKQLKNLIKRVKKNNIDGIDFEFGPMIDKKFIDIVKKENLKSIVWVYKRDDTIQNIRHCNESGIDFFTTNDPLKMKDFK